MFAGQKINIKDGDLSVTGKRVAVIGCGVAGLVSLKTAVEYGHEVVGFERQPDIGGLWNYKLFGGDEGYSKNKDPNIHCYPAYKSLITNTTKYNTMFSDFPPLDTKDIDFLTHEQVCEYAKAYAKHFNLISKIKFNVHVSKIDKKEKKWHVQYKNGAELKTEVFDYVMICTGAFGFPNRVDIKGSDLFKGPLVHSGEVRNGKALFTEKRVLIIGGSYSGGEMMNMAIDNNAKKIYTSASENPSRKSAWCIDRYVTSVYGDKRPWDYLATRENAIVNNIGFGTMLASWCYPFQKSSPEAALSYPGDSIGITSVDKIKNAREKGNLEFVDAIKEMGKDFVILKNGKKLENIDVIVCATGYNQRFPFLDHLWPRSEQTKCELYNYVISPNSKLDGLGFILMQPAGFSLLPLGEMEARWFAHKITTRPYSTRGTIFSDEERKHMIQTIKEKHSKRPAWFRFNYVDDVPFLIDSLAKNIGVQPPDYKTLIQSGEDDKVNLGVALAYGPYVGPQYRIQGAHKWSSAADECVSLSKRFLGNHFDEYKKKVLKGEYPSSGGAVC